MRGAVLWKLLVETQRVLEGDPAVLPGFDDHRREALGARIEATVQRHTAKSMMVAPGRQGRD